MDSKGFQRFCRILLWPNAPDPLRTDKSPMDRTMSQAHTVERHIYAHRYTEDRRCTWIQSLDRRSEFVQAKRETRKCVKM